MPRMNITRNTRAAPQQYGEALAMLGFIAKVANNVSQRGRSAAETDRSRGQAMPTLMDAWGHQRSASGSF